MENMLGVMVDCSRNAVMNVADMEMIIVLMKTEK